MDVALVARSAEELECAKEEVSEMGHRALTLPTDLSNEDEVSTTVERTVEEFGRIDVLVNAARKRISQKFISRLGNALA